MRNVFAVLRAVALTGIGLTIIVIGTLILPLAPRIGNLEVSRAERLTPLSSSALGRSPTGSEVLIEGRVSARNPALVQDFVAYTSEEFHKPGRRLGEWHPDAKRTPPLLIDIPGGMVEITDSLYLFENPPHFWQEPGEPRWDNGTNQGTKRYYGLRAGDPVVVMGRVVQRPTESVLDADLVYAGTRASYISDKYESNADMVWFSGTCIIFGVVMSGLGLWPVLLRRRYATRDRSW